MPSAPAVHPLLAELLRLFLLLTRHSLPLLRDKVTQQRTAESEADSDAAVSTQERAQTSWNLCLVSSKYTNMALNLLLGSMETVCGVRLGGAGSSG